MILLDFNQTAIASLSVQMRDAPSLDEGMLRHIILNTIRAINVKFRGQYDELVIAFDGNNTWRRKVFPYYKHARRTHREESVLDWPSIFQTLAKITDELREFFPYRVIGIDDAEADDVIGVLAHQHCIPDATLIVSGDKDFKQLHGPRVQQYDNVKKKFIVCDDPVLALKELIIRGDKGDGIPNFLSADDCLVKPGGRQKPIMTAKVEQWVHQPIEEFCDTQEKLRNWHRNSELIDLSMTPGHIVLQIEEQYRKQAGKNRAKLMGYFIDKRLKLLQERIGDF